MVIRLSVSSISQMGRVTQGVRLINLKEDSKVSSVSIVDKEENNDDINENDVGAVDTVNIDTESNVVEENTSNESESE